jgi:type VI secretion system protein ImpL
MNADHIIDWHLQIGDQSLRYYGSKEQPQGRWRYGDPLKLSLRWAKNAPWAPLVDGSPNSMRDEKHAVVYSDTSSWSLLRFLRHHAGTSTDFDQLIDLHPHTLGFAIATKPVSVQSSKPYEVNQETWRTKAFIRVTLLSPDKKEQLVMPVFPTRAPALPVASTLPSTVGNRQQAAGHQH